MRSKPLRHIAPILLCVLISTSAAELVAQEPSTLYERLGGYDAIAAVSDDFIVRLATDPELGRFFTGLSIDSQQRLRQHLVDQLCHATGGPCLYTGRDMKTSHEGLGITERDWEISVGHLVATLDRFAVPEAEREELFALLAELKPDIVEVDSPGEQP